MKVYNIINTRYIITVLLILYNLPHTGASFRQRTVLAVILSQNEEFSLPYFLSFFQRLTYPKDRISLYIRSGNNQDKTKQILGAWLKTNFQEYYSLNVILDDNKWNYDTYVEEALEEARRNKFSYFWLLNQKTLLTNQDVLQNMMDEKLLVSAPMVINTKSYYSNFWGKMSDSYDYVRSDDYTEIVHREKRGCFNIAFLDSLFLIDLRQSQSEKLTFNQKHLPITSEHDNALDDMGTRQEKLQTIAETYHSNYYMPLDVRIVFAINAKQNGIDLHVCNKQEHGFVISPFITEVENLQSIKTFIRRMKIPINISEEFLPFMTFPESSNFGFDKTYIINLARQSLRKAVMIEKMKEIGLESTFFEGIDGKTLNESYLSSIGYRPNPHYKDKYLTVGAIGCALSHYQVWEDAINSNYSKVLIFEDDVEFSENFRDTVKKMLAEVEEIHLDWDLIYLGRYPGRDSRENDIQVNNSDHLVTFTYENYDATAYILSHSGLRKLCQQEFISNLLPVDEYISLKYWPVENRYRPMDKISFPINLKTFSIKPLVASQPPNAAHRESDTRGTQYHLDAFPQFAGKSDELLHKESTDKQVDIASNNEQLDIVYEDKEQDIESVSELLNIVLDNLLDIVTNDELLDVVAEKEVFDILSNDEL